MSEADIRVHRGSSHDPEQLQSAFRQAMRRLAGGVAVVSTMHDDVRHGMTVTAVTSLTMDPPALAVSVNRHASAFEAFIRRKRFCVNLLTHQHTNLAVAFSRKPDGDARFASGEWRINDAGLPSLEGSVASITCRLHDLAEFGTHAILIGAVEHLELAPQQPTAPLIYLSGQFGRFWPLSA